MRRSALALAALSLAVPLAASAKAPPPGYLELKAGGYFPTAADVHDYDAGFDGEIALGYAPDPGFAFEIQSGWLETRRSLAGGDRKLEVIPLAFAVKGTVPLGEFQPYATAGVGAYFVHDQVGDASDHSANFGGFVGIGGNWFLSRTLYLGLEGRFLWLRSNTFSAGTRLDGPSLFGKLGFRF